MRSTFYFINKFYMSRGSSVSTVIRLRDGRPVFDSWQGLGSFLLDTASRPPLEPTHQYVEVQLQAFFDLDTRWRWVVSFTPWPLYPQWKSPWYPVDRRLDGPQNRPGRGGEDKNYQLRPGLEPSIIQPVAQRYNHWAIPAPWYLVKQKEKFTFISCNVALVFTLYSRNQINIPKDTGLSLTQIPL
jgi:hypothetical protein